MLFARTVTDEVPTAYHTSRDVAKAFVHFATSIVSDKASVEERWGRARACASRGGSVDVSGADVANACVPPAARPSSTA